MVVTCFIEQLVKVVFNSHYYMWDRKIYHQKQGAPTGLRSSCPVRRAMMDDWVEKITKLEERIHTLNSINPEKYSRLDLYQIAKYVDYVITALEKFTRGTISEAC